MAGSETFILLEIMYAVRKQEKQPKVYMCELLNNRRRQKQKVKRVAAGCVISLSCILAEISSIAGES